MNSGEPEGTIGAPPVSVFVSYAHEDQAQAEKLIAALEQAGCTVWWDGLVDGGTSFAKSIEDALEQADVILVLWSKQSVASHWVRDEAERGRDRGRLVPVTFDGSLAPMGFRQVQTLEMARWRGGKTGPIWTGLMRAVMLAAGASEVPERAARISVADGPSRRALLVGGGAASLAALGGLGAWQAGLFTPPAADNSVAVIPFKNLSGDPEQDYLAEGISEEIRIQLARYASLSVMAPVSVGVALRDSPLAADIANKLQVGFLINGSVRMSGRKMTVTAEMSDVGAGTTLWSDRFAFSEVLVADIPAHVGSSIMKVMGAQLTQANSGPKSGPARMQGGTRNYLSYEAYLRGNAYYRLRAGEASYRSALRQFEIAVEQDGNFALAHSNLAKTLTVITSFFSPPSEFRANYERARQSAEKAAAIAPGNAQIQAALGFVMMDGFMDFRGSDRQYDRAAKLNSGDANVLAMLASHWAGTGRLAEARKAATGSLRLDPLNPSVLAIAAQVDYVSKDYDSAIAKLREALALTPTVDFAHAGIGDSLYQQGRYDRARTSYLEEHAMTPRLTGLALAEFKLGNLAAAKNARLELATTLSETSAYQEAQICAQWGEPVTAIQKLNLAVERKDPGLSTIAADPMLNPLRARPDFKLLLKGIGIA